MSAGVPVITVDGPSGAGKGTVCRRLAVELGWHYLDSGAIYRALAVAAIDAKIKLSSPVAVAKVAQHCVLSFRVEAEDCYVLVNGEDITDRLRHESTGHCASKIAAMSEVRAVLLDVQRNFCTAPGLVADGRDMGTVVFPDAQTKVFLTASTEIRALRRYKQLKEKGLSDTLEKITDDLRIRDERDIGRQTAPLKAAIDAVLIDSSELTIDEVVFRIRSYYSGNCGD